MSIPDAGNPASDILCQEICGADVRGAHPELTLAVRPNGVLLMLGGTGPFAFVQSCCFYWNRNQPFGVGAGSFSCFVGFPWADSADFPPLGWVSGIASGWLLQHCSSKRPGGFPVPSLFVTPSVLQRKCFVDSIGLGLI